MDAIDWFGALTTLVAAASTIVAMTPTPRDDRILGKAYKVLELMALAIGKAKELPANKKSGG